MARNRFVRNRSFNSGPRRKTEWLASADVTGQTALAASSVILDSSFAFTQPETIVRTRGSLWVSSDQATANEEPFGALGMMVVSDQAAAAGVAAVPTPIQEEDDDNWFVWVPFLASLRLATAVGFVANPFMEYKFDSKAMRKVAAGDTLIVVLENASSTDAMNYVVKFRTLTKLH